MSEPGTRRVLIISPSFPPMNTPDMQRARMSLPYYRYFGWEPHVLTVDPFKQDGAREDALLETIPDDVPVYRCGALPLTWSRRLGIGNLGLRSWANFLVAGARIIRREKIDLVFFTNTQFVTFTLGRLWRAWLGVPYVIDLQDPWRTDYYQRAGSRKPPGGWKYQFARLQAWLLEGWSFRRMAGFISVSEHYIRDLQKRYVWFSKIPAETIRFGASETDMAVARRLSATAALAVPATAPGVRRFVYTGAAGPIMPHALKVLFGALKRFREQNPTEAARLRFEFLGTSYAKPDRAKATVVPIAAEYGVQDQVVEVASRLGHLECLEIQAKADVLLLLGSSDLAYSPSKLYPYYLARRPILTVAFRNSYLASIVTDLSCATLVTFEENESKEAAYAALVAFFRQSLAVLPDPMQGRNEDLFRREFLAETLTQRQCALFSTALQTT